MMTNYADIVYEVRGALGRITLNRPEKRNALGSNTVAELCHALERAKADEAVRVLVLSGAGTVFSAGGDLGQLGGTTTGKTEVPPRSFVDLNLLFTTLGKPTIAMVNGHAVAGGLGLVVACDLAVAADDAKFGTPEINVGLWPMMIMATIFRSVGRKAGLLLMLTGEKIDAAEAVRIGLINRAVPRAELEQYTLALAETLAKKSPAALSLGLMAFYRTEDLALEPALKHLEGQLGAVLATEDAREGLMAFMQKRPPLFRGH
jgi:enoyl-CoA hydratase/carnithine racemase